MWINRRKQNKTNKTNGENHPIHNMYSIRVFVREGSPERNTLGKQNEEKDNKRY